MITKLIFLKFLQLSYKVLEWSRPFGLDVLVWGLDPIYNVFFIIFFSCTYKPTPVFFILIGRFSKVFQKFKRTPIMLHFQYLFTKIKTQTFSLILFEAYQENKFLKDNSHASYEDFLFIAVEKERQVFYRRQQNEKS